MRELFDVVKNLLGKNFIAIVRDSKRQKRKLAGSLRYYPQKRLRTPSPLRITVDEQIEELLLLKNRMKYALNSSNSFILSAIIKAFPALPTTYQAIMGFNPLHNSLVINSKNITAAIITLKDLLLNSIIISQQSNWILVTQVKFYYKDIQIDDVVVVNKYGKHPKQLEITMEKREEGRGDWVELCFTYRQFEVIATGGLHSQKGDASKFGAFLGVAAPSHMAHDTNFILLSPTQPAAATSCPRMLRNYQRRSSLFNWCFKASFFEEMGFSTPCSLRLYETEPTGYAGICSKLIYLVSYNEYTRTEKKELKQMLRNIQYYKDLGLEKPLGRGSTLQRLEDVKVGKLKNRRKLSMSKILLIEVLLKRYSRNIENHLLMKMYNSIIAPKVKKMNQERVNRMISSA